MGHLARSIYVHLCIYAGAFNILTWRYLIQNILANDLYAENCFQRHLICGQGHLDRGIYMGLMGQGYLVRGI